jgi:2-isopropylmalate synthase
MEMVLVSIAVSSGYEVEFSCEDYSRSYDNFNFVNDLLMAVAQAGVSIINVADTVGIASKYQGEKYFVNILNRHELNIRSSYPQITWAVHCHNDFGLALENTMNAIVDGPVREIQGCINGIGERAGNVALEQCIMIIEEFLNEKFYHTVNLTEINEISDFVSQKMLKKNCYMPIVGSNIAKHSAGGHTNALLVDPKSYQAFDLNKINTNMSLVFGPSSGGNHAKKIFESFGYYVDEHEKTDIACKIKKLIARKKIFSHKDMLEAYIKLRSPIKIDFISCKKENSKLKINIRGKLFDLSEFIIICLDQKEAVGEFSKLIELYFKKIEKINYKISEILLKNKLTKYKCYMEISIDSKETFKGEAVSSNTFIALIRAFTNTINQSYVYHNYSLNR